jgi:magnesium-protoporphyrin O-methyltransferase
MSSHSDLATRLRDLYSGEAGEAWTRIERESPATYWEENAILGRRDTYKLLLERLQPIAGRRVLDAGCGRGLLARRLAAEGALATGVDLVSHRVLEARGAKGGGAPTFAVADFRDLIQAAGAFDDMVIQEVLEDYTTDERRETIDRLAESRVPRIHVIFRQPGRWGSLIAPMMPEGLIATLDSVPLLRSIHLHTPYRLAHQESIRRRSYSVLMVQFTLEAE